MRAVVGALLAALAACARGPESPVAEHRDREPRVTLASSENVTGPCSLQCVSSTRYRACLTGDFGGQNSSAVMECEPGSHCSVPVRGHIPCEWDDCPSCGKPQPNAEPPRALNASQYDRGCRADSDCVAVSTDPCQCDCNPRMAINRSAEAQFRQEMAARAQRCPMPPISCDCGVEPRAMCARGICERAPPG